MPSPFPGMDPYLEDPHFYGDLHQGLAVCMANQLAPILRPKYVARLNTDDILDLPDEEELQVMFPGVSSHLSVPFRQVTVEIHSVSSGRLVAAIEILSPVNKRADSDGRDAYLRKRDSLLGTSVHLLEIDLLRRGERLPVEPPIPASADYAIVLSRADARLDAEIWPIALADPLPVVPIPLLPPDADVALDLQAAIDAIYERAGYDLDVDYSVAPWPPLTRIQSVWAEEVLRRIEHG